MKLSKYSLKMGSNDVDRVCVRLWIVYNFVYKSNRFPRNVPRQVFLKIFSLNVNTANFILAKNMHILYYISFTVEILKMNFFQRLKDLGFGLKKFFHCYKTVKLKGHPTARIAFPL